MGINLRYSPLEWDGSNKTLTFASSLYNTIFTIGNSGSDTVNFTAKLGSQLYHNLSDQSYTVLKIHNHDTTAEIGGLETKGDLKNTTGLCLGQGNYWSYEPTGDTGTPTTLSASENVVAVDTGVTVTSGNMYSVSGHAQLYGTMNGGTVNVAGVIGVISGAGANTHVLHMACVQAAISTGVVNPTTGTLSHFLANNTGTCVVDNLICMQASQYITNFASFNMAASGKCITAADTAMTTNNTSYAIRILVEGVAMYIPAWDTANWS